MQQKSIISTRERKILEQKLSLMFSLRALGQNYSAEYEYVKRLKQLAVDVIRGLAFDNVILLLICIQQAAGEG